MKKKENSRRKSISVVALLLLSLIIALSGCSSGVDTIDEDLSTELSNQPEEQPEEQPVEDNAEAFNANELLGIWYFLPDHDSDVPVPSDMMWDPYLTREPHILRLFSNNRAGYSEGARYTGGRGMPAAYHYTGSWYVEKNTLYMDLIGRSGESLNMEIAVEGIEDNSLMLRWISGPPPYWLYEDLGGEGYQTGQGAFNDVVRFSSSEYYLEYRTYNENEGVWVPDDFESKTIQRPNRFVDQLESYVTTDVLNVRSGPGTDYDLVWDPIPGNTIITKIGEMDGDPSWMFVEFSVAVDSVDMFHVSEPGYFGYGYDGSYSYCLYGWVNTEFVVLAENVADSEATGDIVFPITPEVAKEIVREYYVRTSPNYVPKIYDDGGEQITNGEVVLVIHAYNIVENEFEGHTVTAGWIGVGRDTGNLYDMVMGEVRITD